MSTDEGLEAQGLGQVTLRGKALKEWRILTKIGVISWQPGLQFSRVRAERALFGINDLAFASADQIDRSQVEGLPLEAAATPGEMTFDPPAPRQLMYRMAP